MAMQEFQYIQSILKDVYGKAIVNQVAKKSPLWAIFEKKTAEFAGKRMVTSLQTSFVESVGARAANNYDLPTPSRAGYDQTYVVAKRVYGRVQVDVFSIESSKGKGGWVDVLTNEIKSATNAFAIDIDRQLLGNGKGILGVVASVASNVITVKDPGGVVGDTPITKFFRVGQIIDIYAPSGGTKRADSVEITAVNPANNTITVSSAGTAAANDLILREDVLETTTYSSGELMGINGIIDTGNYPTDSEFQGIDATSKSFWRAYVKSSAGALTETLIQEALDQIEQNTDGEPIDLMVTTYAVRNKLIALMQALRKIDTLDLKAGWKAIKYVGGSVELPVMVHPKAPAGYIYLISTPHIKLYQLKPLEWDDAQGGVVKNVAGKDVYEAFFRFYGNLGTDCRNAHGKLTGVTTA